MTIKQFNDLHSSLKKRKNNKNKSSSTINCYLKWDDQAEEKSYLEKMHNEIINMPVMESLSSLHKFGYLGYLREEVYDGAGETYAINHLFSEAWSEEVQNSSKKDRYCKVSSDVLKTRLPKAIEITIQREEKLEDRSNKKNKTTRKNREATTPATTGKRRRRLQPKSKVFERFRAIV